jgi:IstB-like ATP binding protein
MGWSGRAPAPPASEAGKGRHRPEVTGPVKPARLTPMYGPAVRCDWGLEPLDAAARHDLLEILDDRYGHHSTIVTSQLPVDQWHALIGDPTYADGACTHWKAPPLHGARQ